MLTSSASRSPATSAKHRYVPRGRNQLHTIFERHFDEFCNNYDARYVNTYGVFRVDRIHDIGKRFLTCGDHRQGVARIRCTNPACGRGYGCALVDAKRQERLKPREMAARTRIRRDQRICGARGTASLSRTLATGAGSCPAAR